MSKKVLSRYPDRLETRLFLTLNVIRNPENLLLLSYAFNKSLMESFYRERGKYVYGQDLYTSRYLNKPLKEIFGLGDSIKFLQFLLQSGYVKTRPYDFVNEHRSVWDLTPEGKIYGRPISNFTIKYSVDNKIPVNRIFYSGYPFDIRNQNPYLRLLILRQLRKLIGESVRKEHLKLDIKANQGQLNSGLDTLIKFGLIKYHKFKADFKGSHSFKWTSNLKFEEFRGSLPNEYTRRIANILIERGECSVEDMVADLNLPTSRVVHSLENLVQRKLIIKGDEIPAGIRYDFGITKKGLKFYEDFCLSLVRILNDDRDFTKLYKEEIPLEIGKDFIKLQ